MSPTDLPLVPILACLLLSGIAVAGSVWLARRRGRWLTALGVLAAAALLGTAALLPRVSRPPAPPVAAAAAPVTGNVEASPLRQTRDTAPAAEVIPLSLPPRVILRGRWAADDSAVVASTLAHALTRVPAAGGGVLELQGTGQALRPTRRGVQQYAIAATWTLRPTANADVLAGSGLGEVLGIGASPDQARRGAAANVAHAIATTLRASLPAPRSVVGASSPSF